MVLRYPGFARARRGMAGGGTPLATLRFSGVDRTSLCHLRRNPLRDRIFSRKLFRSMEMEPARLWRALRNFDPRYLRSRRCDHARTAVAAHEFQRRREKFRSDRDRDRFAGELVLPFVATAWFFLSSFQILEFGFAQYSPFATRQIP